MKFETPEWVRVPKDTNAPWASSLHLLTMAVFLAMFVYALIETLGFRDLAKRTPLFVTIGGTALVSAELIASLVRWRKSTNALPADSGSQIMDIVADTEGVDVDGAARHRLLASVYYFGWVLLFVAVMYITNFLIATVLFVATFGTVQARFSRLAVAVGCFVVGVLIYLIGFEWELIAFPPPRW